MNSGFTYLKQRGFTSETVKEFDLMYYDGNTTYGLDTTQQRGVCDDVKPFFKDTFKNSILFPVFNLYNELVAVTARRFDGKPKFDSSSFNKRSILYGLNKTYKDILLKDAVFITEGPFDFLMLWQTGIRNCVSSYGCNLNYEQYCLCARFTTNFNIIYDNDDAGKTGADKAKKLITAYGGTCNIINLPYDLDEYIIKYGVEEFLKHVHTK